VERGYNGPARVAGSAGTGKTIVALHRAVSIARKHADARILLTTFSETLANSLRSKLRRLLGNEPRVGERLEVHSMSAVARRLYRAHLGGKAPQLASRAVIRENITEAAAAVAGHKFTPRFLLSEWEEVVDAWQLDTWENYRGVQRLGRKTRLPEAQRTTLWQIFSMVRAGLKANGLITEARMFSELASKLAPDSGSPFDFVVVDEAQDVSISQLRFIAALGKNRSDALFFAGDLGSGFSNSLFPGKRSA
jgi:superfamily I DNA/RNA helicase